MAIVVEDGTRVTGANSYVTEAELTTYATARGITITGDTEELLIKAMDYLESLEYKGIKVAFDQALQWPRADVYIDDYLVDIDEIPYELKKAEYEVALSIDAGVDPLANITRLKDSVSVGPISVTYSKTQATTIVRKIDLALRKLLRAGASGASFPVLRG